MSEPIHPLEAQMAAELRVMSDRQLLRELARELQSALCGEEPVACIKLLLAEAMRRTVP